MKGSIQLDNGTEIQFEYKIKTLTVQVPEEVKTIRMSEQEFLSFLDEPEYYLYGLSGQ